MAGRNYRDLKAWQKAIDLVQAVYEASATWPASELYGLTAQARRAAVSIPANIAEGQGRRTAGDFARHLNIAHGSLRELETHFVIANRLGYCGEPALAAILEACAEVGRLVTGLLNYAIDARQH